jgi:hypothetical protein
MATSHRIDRESVGTWSIEILTVPDETGNQTSLFEREFVILGE